MIPSLQLRITETLKLRRYKLNNIVIKLLQKIACLEITQFYLFDCYQMYFQFIVLLFINSIEIK